MTMVKKVKYDCIADCGCARVDTEHAASFFSNGFGDGGFSVFITDRDSFLGKENEFLEQFLVKGHATISHYDCNNDPVGILPKGRYGVYNRDGDVYFVYWDDGSRMI